MMEFLWSIDSVICILVGAAIGWLAGRVTKGFGLYGNLAAGAVGGVIGGLAFDKMNIIDVGDYADPVIAGVTGAVIVMAIAGLYMRLQEP